MRCCNQLSCNLLSGLIFPIFPLKWLIFDGLLVLKVRSQKLIAAATINVVPSALFAPFSCINLTDINALLPAHSIHINSQWA